MTTVVIAGPWCDRSTPHHVGGVPKTLPLFQGAGAEVQKHVSVYRQIPDFLTLDKLASTKQSVLVVGGGFLGSELAVALASRGGRGKGWSRLCPTGGWGRGGAGCVLPVFHCPPGKARERVVTQLFPEGGNMGEGWGKRRGGEGRGREGGGGGKWEGGREGGGRGGGKGRRGGGGERREGRERQCSINLVLFFRQSA